MNWVMKSFCFSLLVGSAWKIRYRLLATLNKVRVEELMHGSEVSVKSKI